ncbi:MAG: hypothetical protein LBQ55_06895 [Treponema sp.]|jgi:hypothetical protein|nr:hypothetical protein [Treponema sp.]
MGVPFFLSWIDAPAALASLLVVMVPLTVKVGALLLLLLLLLLVSPPAGLSQEKKVKKVKKKQKKSEIMLKLARFLLGGGGYHFTYRMGGPGRCVSINATGHDGLLGNSAPPDCVVGLPACRNADHGNSIAQIASYEKRENDFPHCPKAENRIA